MADTIKSVVAVINGESISLTYNSASGLYEASGVAPQASSFNLNGGYYPVTVTATYMTDESTTVNDKTTGTVGQGCRFVVRERYIPTVNITFPTAGQYITSTGAQRLEMELRDNTVQSAGYSGIDISSLNITVGGREIPHEDLITTTVAGGYDITYTPTEPLPDGAYTILASVSDNDGNTSAVTETSFVIDTAPPELSVIAPIEALATSNSAILVKGFTSDATGLNVAVAIAVDGTVVGNPTVASDGSFEYTVNLTNEGDRVITITATDSSGKTSIVTRNIYYSTAVPTITSVELVPNPADGGTTYTIRVDVS